MKVIKPLVLLLCLTMAACKIPPKENIRIYREKDFSSFNVCPVVTLPKPIVINDTMVKDLSRVTGTNSNAQKQTDTILLRHINQMKTSITKQNKEIEELNKKYWVSCYNYDIGKHRPKSTTQPAVKKSR